MGKNNGAVMCINTGVIYATASEAARALDLPESGVSRVINGLRKDHRGLCFVRCDSTASVDDLEQFRRDQLRNVYLIYDVDNCSISFYGADNNRFFD